MNVVDSLLEGALLQEFQHLWLDVDAQHLALLAHAFRELQGVEAVAAAHVANGLAGLHPEGLQQRLATFLPLPGLADQPGRALVRQLLLLVQNGEENMRKVVEELLFLHFYLKIVP